jgi:hypothetical protein
MRNKRPGWRVKDKFAFLLAVMGRLAGGAHISFEGDLDPFPLAEIRGASSRETEVLKRNTLWPKQDFIVLPLEETTIQQITKAMGGSWSRRIYHIQIEKKGTLEFGTYDSFDPACFNFGPALDHEFMAFLTREELLEEDWGQNG